MSGGRRAGSPRPNPPHTLLPLHTRHTPLLLHTRHTPRPHDPAHPRDPVTPRAAWPVPADALYATVPLRHPLVAFVVGRRARPFRYALIGAVLAFVIFGGVAERAAAGGAVSAAAVALNGALFAGLLGLVVFHARVLVPGLLVRGRVGAYALAALALAAAFVAALEGIMRLELGGLPPPEAFTVVGFIDTLLLPLVFIGATAGVQMFGRWVGDAARLREAETRQLRAELAHLRGQLHPHFLFNTLNNLEALVRTDPPRALSVLENLGEVLRYGLYDGSPDDVWLVRDVEHVRRLLSLEAIRRDRFDIDVQTAGPVGAWRVAPFLILPYVENAVKHSATAEEASYVRVHVEASEGEGRPLLRVRVENSKPSVAPFHPAGGLGLENARRRLELLYPGRHTVTVDETPTAYAVTLSLYPGPAPL